MTDAFAQRAPCTAPELLLKLVLTGTQSHYENRGIIDDKRLEHLLHAGKQILFKSHQESDVRQSLGFSSPVWQGLTTVLSAATPVLEQLCFIYKCPNPSTYNNSSSELVAANCFTLVKEIERLNDLCTIARNLLATTKRAQNLAADRGFDQQILKLIDVCVKVTARGFDGTNVRVEERHQKVCNLFKRLLITCLQFLHNFIMHNEHRKLVLWLDLFGNSQGTEGSHTQAGEGLPNTSAQSIDSVQRPTPAEGNAKPQKGAATTSQNASNASVANGASEAGVSSEHDNIPYTLDDVNSLFDVMSGDKEPSGQAQDTAKSLMDRIKHDMEQLSGLRADQLDRNPEIMLKVGAALRAQLPVQSPRPTNSNSRPGAAREDSTRAASWNGLPDITAYGNFLSDQDITADDLVMPRTSESAADTLQEAKDELMARLQDGALVPEETDEPLYDKGHVQDAENDDEALENIEDSVDDEEEDEEEEDYQNLNDQERGLLTDVPLVLGPTEIEALPMIIQAGIVDNFGNIKNSSDRQGAKNMQAVRCHILLAQEAGRNVLRELLIFIAAWDLPDDEFYFKMMVQIMESILKNGLMSHAYSDFGQAKDIISPAQAVVIKILTHIFRSKYSPSSGQNNSDQPPPRPKIPAPLSRVDVLTVRYIFTVFRGNIIPETCALIYLQGQIRAGLAMAEDFPLNLWDMERVYEGVYQFLEFFAVLTENNDWKRLLVEWEIVYDLVTLLKELDASIPKAPLSASVPSAAASQSAMATASSASQSTAPQTNQNTEQQSSSTVTTQSDPQSTTTSSKASTLPLPPPPPARAQSPAAPTPSEDPSTFEWRNLKKLIVLVLSSLVWKSLTVQTQIRDNVGVEIILSCTQYDGHNPYIKEHAVMCLKFLLEGNKENQAIVRDLEAKGVVDQSGLEDKFGVKARVDEGGRVRVSPVDAPPNSGATGSSSSNGGTAAAGRTSVNPGAGERARRMARRASESNAVQDLLGERFARLDLGRGNAAKHGGGQQQNQHLHQQQRQEQGRILGEEDENGDDVLDLDEEDDEDDDDEIEFM